MQHRDKDDGCESDACLSAECLGWSAATHPVYLDVCRHEARPVSASCYPGTYFARAFWVAVKEVGVDGGGDDHDANALHSCKDSNGHVVPLVLKSESEENETNTENKCGGVENNKACFWVETAVVMFGVIAADGVVEEVTGEPANNDTNNPEEIKVTWVQLAEYH